MLEGVLPVADVVVDVEDLEGVAVLDEGHGDVVGVDGDEAEGGEGGGVAGVDAVMPTSVAEPVTT